MHFLEKVWTISENVEIFNLSQQKEKMIFGVRTKLSYYKLLHRKFIINRNIKKYRDTFEQTFRFRTFNAKIFNV